PVQADQRAARDRANRHTQTVRRSRHTVVFAHPRSSPPQPIKSQNLTGAAIGFRVSAAAPLKFARSFGRCKLTLLARPGRKVRRHPSAAHWSTSGPAVVGLATLAGARGLLALAKPLS